MNVLSSLLYYIGQEIEDVRNKFSAIGTLKTAQKEVQISTAGIDTYTDGASVSISAGTWVIVGQFDFQTAPTAGTRNLNAVIASGNTIITGTRVFVADNYFQRLQVSLIRSTNSTETIYIKGSSSKTTTSVGMTAIRAVRIK